VTGSVASSLFGEPRLTHDIDIIVQITAQEAVALSTWFPSPRYYLDDSEHLHEAVRRESMFNLVDTVTGDKGVFWVLTGSPFDTSRFQKRRRVTMFSCSIWVSSPEDTILAKLRWADISGGSEKQFTDALRVFEVQQGNVDI
jgi:hypothetical protein